MVTKAPPNIIQEHGFVQAALPSLLLDVGGIDYEAPGILNLSRKYMKSTLVKEKGRHFFFFKLFLILRFPSANPSQFESMTQSAYGFELTSHPRLKRTSEIRSIQSTQRADSIFSCTSI